MLCVCETARKGETALCNGARVESKLQKRCRRTQNLISSVVDDMLVHVCRGGIMLCE